MQYVVGALRLVLLLAGGCGRQGFDAAIDSGGDGDGERATDAPNGDASVVTDAPPDAMVDASAACINDLSSIGTGNFEIFFTLQAAPTEKSALVFQRDPCTAPTYWDIHLDGANRAVFELSAGGNLSSTPTQMPVADGTPHLIRATRIGTSVAVTVDGGALNSQSGPTFNFGPLPPLEIAGGHACAGFAALATGTVTNVCARPL